MGMKWLITGGCGFIGRNLVKDLLAERDHSIRIIDNLSVGKREDLLEVCAFEEIDAEPIDERNPDFAFRNSSKVSLIVADILDADLALKITEDVDIIVHLAANTGVAPSVENPRNDCLNNVMGIFNYLEAARHNKVKRFIFASSGAPVGECVPPIHEEIAPHPVSPYGASKMAGEGYCSAYYRTFGVETVALRFGNVYGPLSKHKSSAVAKFIRRAMRGDVIEIYGDGKQTRDFIFIDDLIRAIRLSAEMAEIGGEVFQIAAHKETTVSDLVDKLLKITSDHGLKTVEVRNTSPRKGDVLRNYSDTTKAKTILGWEPRISLDEGLRRTFEWFT
jgi:UDP-glucose 4-epimerase